MSMVPQKSRPEQPRFSWEAVPSELKERKQWVLWRYEQTEKGKWTKVPYQPNGQKAQTNHPPTWTSFIQAVKAYESNPRFDGVGFVLFKDDPYTAIDLDHLADWKEEAQEIIRMFNSYTELSPSGNGVHIWVRGKLPVAGKKAGNKEAYREARYLTVTGNRMEGTPETIEERQETLEWFYQRWLAAPSPASVETATQDTAKGPEKEDGELIAKAQKAKNGEKFALLYNGEWEEAGYSSQSEADQAFCNLLAYWTGRNAEQMDKIFRQSGLMRDKWDEKHFADGRTYGQVTIQKALADVKEVYEEKKNQVLDMTRRKYFDGDRFSPPLLAEDIMSRQPFFCDGRELYAYQNGVYYPNGRWSVRLWCKDLLGNEYRSNRVSECIHYIETATWVGEGMNINPDDGFINVKNGLLNWKTGELVPHTPERLSTIQLPVEYDPQATCPRVLQFLNEVIPPDTIPVLLEFFGYCLVPNTKHEKALMFTGSKGSNGKSTTINLFTALLGKQNTVSVPLQELAESRWKRADLQGKLLNAFADISHKAVENSGLFKAIVSGDSIDAERKGKDPFYFNPFAKLLFSANDLPGSTDVTDAYFRRWLIIPFPHTFEHGKNADENLFDKLTTPQELSGLLNLCLEGLRRLERQGGFSESKTIQDALKAYRGDTDSVTGFMEECCILEEGARVSKNELYEAYQAWCENAGLKPLGKIRFGRRVKDITNIEEGRIHGGIRVYRGIRYVANDDEELIEYF